MCTVQDIALLGSHIHVYGTAQPLNRSARSRHIKSRSTSRVRGPDLPDRETPKEEIADAARLLATQMAHYQRKFGVVPTKEALVPMTTESLPDEQAGWIADGLENLAVALSTVHDEGQEKPSRLQ